MTECPKCCGMGVVCDVCGQLDGTCYQTCEACGKDFCSVAFGALSACYTAHNCVRKPVEATE